MIASKLVNIYFKTIRFILKALSDVIRLLPTRRSYKLEDIFFFVGEINLRGLP